MHPTPNHLDLDASWVTATLKSAGGTAPSQRVRGFIIGWDACLLQQGFEFPYRNISVFLVPVLRPLSFNTILVFLVSLLETICFQYYFSIFGAFCDHDSMIQ